jgi:hypothetical protein
VPRRFKILRDAGFTEDSAQPVIWIERSRRQAFSENVIGDHDVAWLNERLAETVPEPEFWFYFLDLSADPIKDCKGPSVTNGDGRSIAYCTHGRPSRGCCAFKLGDVSARARDSRD